MKTKTVITLLSAFAITSTLPAQDWAKAKLEKSPRHLEWIKVKHDNREVNCSIAYPEVKGKATAVVVIHEIFGLTDWVRSVTDQLAEAGYIAIAPDLLSGAAPGGGYEPGRGARRGALPWPALGSAGKRLLRCFLGEIEVAEEADQRSEDAAPLVAEDPLENG